LQALEIHGTSWFASVLGHYDSGALQRLSQARDVVTDVSSGRAAAHRGSPRRVQATMRTTQLVTHRSFPSSGWRGVSAGVLVVGIGLIAPAQSSAATTEKSWKKVAPAKVGLDARKLKKVASIARQGKSNCLVVVKDGKIAGEWYFRGTGKSTAQNVFSVSKSITSTLVGIARDEGDLRLEDPASTWIPEWAATASAAVTVRDLLTNASGRQWSAELDYGQLLRAADRSAFAVGLGQAQPPGTVWAYNNSAIQTLQPVLQHATGEDVDTFAHRRLFKPVGMRHTAMTLDRAGNAQMFSGIHSTCRDLARFGLLMLKRGRWAGQQIVSSGWVDKATGRPSTPLNAAYGYLWWLNREGIVADPFVVMSPQQAADGAPRQGQIVPGSPDEMFWAIGTGNQLVQVDPSTRTVVVRLGTTEPRPKPPTFGPAEASKVVTDVVTRR
jgi:CubicO group peptidase (beta-lactamase class C family)